MFTQQLYSSRKIYMAALIAAAFAGCAEAPEATEPASSPDEPAPVVNGKPDGLTMNALTSNALTSNALTSNALTSNALTTNALTTNALTSNALTANALTDPLARELLTYVVSCALPAGQDLELHIDGVDYSFPGSLGLAAGWGMPGGSCGPECKSWVSACVLSRVDHLGVHVEISLRGARPELATEPSERLGYPNREATYWGDVFASPQVRKACLSPRQSEIPRVCGPSIEGCVMDVVGSCNDVCDGVLPDGGFVGCGGRAARRERGDITVFLQ